jgi:hypothetical protein
MPFTEIVTEAVFRYAAFASGTQSQRRLLALMLASLQRIHAPGIDRPARFVVAFNDRRPISLPFKPAYAPTRM